MEGKTILLIDDDEDFILQNRIEFEAAGYTVLTASSAKEGESCFSSQKPDLVVADLMLEEEDAGFMLCYKFKKECPEIPIVMVTGVSSETGIPFNASTSEERKWIKADVLLSKPVRFEQLEGEVSRLLTNS